MEYSVGRIVEGKIIHISDDYILVRLPSKETGILHKNRMSPLPDSILSEIYRRGETVLVSIDRITDKGYIFGRKDIENRYDNQKRHDAKLVEKQKRVAEMENMRQLVETRSKQLERGCIYEVEVEKYSKNGVQVSIDGAIAFIKKEEIDWNANGEPSECFFVGEIIKAVYLGFNDGKLWFSVKNLENKLYDMDLFDLMTKELLGKLGFETDTFYAAALDINGLCLTNLYAEKDGRILMDPFYGGNVIVRFVPSDIKENHFYKIQIELVATEERLEQNNLLLFKAHILDEVSNPYKIDVETAFCKHISPATNSSISNLLNEVGLNMYSSPERMFFELIQNADDASSQKGVSISIDRNENYLIFCHNGFHFSKKDFESIVSAAKSTKSSKEKTGYKGIGFKSVFTNSQQVYVCSGGYHFVFDKNEPIFDDFDKFYFKVNNKRTKEEQESFLKGFQSEKQSFRGVDDIPWQLLPIWYDETPEVLKKTAFVKNQKVSFALNIKNSKIDDYVKAIEYLFDNPNFILFLRHTNRLDLKFCNKTITKEVNDNIIMLKSSFGECRSIQLLKKNFDNIVISNESFSTKDIAISIREITNRRGEPETKFYGNNNEILEDIPDRIASSKTTEISFVVNYTGNEISTIDGKSLYAYLPMNEHRFPFPFYINADFVLSSNRESLLDNPWNYYLMANIGESRMGW